MRGRHVADWAGRAVRRDSQACRFSYRSDLLQLVHSAAILHVWHDRIDCTAPDVPEKLTGAPERLAAGGWNVSLLVELRQVLSRAAHLLHPIETVLLQAGSDVHRLPGIEATVSIDEQVAVGADRLSYSSNESHAPLYPLFVRVRVTLVPRHMVERSQLERIEACRGAAHGIGGESLRRSLLTPSGTVDVGVVADHGAQFSAEKLVAGNSHGLAL